MYPILEGLRVVEASAFVAAPTGGLTLAQLGADVIRVDSIGGGGGRRALAARRERREHLLGEPQVAAITARQWKSLLDAIGGHEAMRHVEAMLGVDLSDEGQRFEARDVIAPVVARWVGARGYDEVRAAFDAAGVCWWGLASRSWRWSATTRAARRGTRCSRMSTSRGSAAS